MTIRRVAAVIAAVTTGLWASDAHAHLVSARFGDYYGGLLHPLTALDYLLPWVTLGLLAGLQPLRVGRWIPLVFALGVFLGLVTALMIRGAPVSPMAEVASFVVLGALVAVGRAWPAPFMIGLAGVVGWVDGYGNGLAITPAINALLFISGVMTAAVAVLLLVTAATVVTTNAGDWRRIAVRAVGSWIAAAGVMIAGLNLAA